MEIGLSMLEKFLWENSVAKKSGTVNCLILV